MEVIDATSGGTFRIPAPKVTHEQSQDALATLDVMQEKYGISSEDLDLLYNAMVAIFIRVQLFGLGGCTPGEDNG